jgi:glycosyltransferase involved in cell wall biosynthesis
MNIGIYNEPAGSSLGGSDYLAAVLASGLPDEHTVEFLHHHSALTSGRLEMLMGVDPSRFTLKHVDRRRFDARDSRSMVGGLNAARQWNAELSRPYDVFVAIVHGMPPVCHAERGLLIVLFPFFRPFGNWPLNDPPRGVFDLRRKIRNHLYRSEWRRRLESYDTIVSISEFTRTWTRELWDAESRVVYPPVEVGGAAEPKENRIISVGRFTTSGHSKKQLDVVRLFGTLPDVGERGWVYETIGAVGESAADIAYHDEVSALARQHGVIVSSNLSRPELQRRYLTSKLFIHAAGLGEPADKPELSEHFGISTVEAMAAGCVPLVVNRGAQPEIVQHGVNGLVWSSLDELASQVRELTSDDHLRARMAEAARARALAFSRQSFVGQMNDILLPSSTRSRWTQTA